LSNGKKIKMDKINETKELIEGNLESLINHFENEKDESVNMAIVGGSHIQSTSTKVHSINVIDDLESHKENYFINNMISQCRYVLPSDCLEKLIGKVGTPK
jgi:hypothetical protein